MHRIRYVAICPHCDHHALHIRATTAGAELATTIVATTRKPPPA